MKFDPNGRILDDDRPQAGVESTSATTSRGSAAGARAGGAPAGEGRGAGAGGAAGAGRGGPPPAPPVVGAGVEGESFNRPTDVGWDAQATSSCRRLRQLARLKYDKNGVFLKMAGHRGAGPARVQHTRTVWPWTHRATSTSRTAATTACRCSTTS